MADPVERSVGEETAERYVHALDDVSALGDLRDRSIFDGPYRRLFTAQCISSFGDWLGFLAVVSLASAYGTILPAVLFYPALTAVAGLLGHVHEIAYLHHHEATFAIYLDVVTFFVSAYLISGLPLPRRTPAEQAAVAAATPKSMFRDAQEGWSYIRRTYRVRAVILGFCTGLIGGGMVVPLGVTYSANILHAGFTGFGLLEMALGIGVAVGVILVSLWHRRVSYTGAFGWAVFAAGVSLMLSASLARLALVMLAIGLFGAFVGAVYVLGLTILGTSTSDAIRGRIFGMFYTLVRLCLLLAFTLAPLLSGLLDGASYHFTRTVHGRVVHHEIGNSTLHVGLPGTRLTLWFGGVIIVIASLVTRRAPG